MKLVAGLGVLLGLAAAGSFAQDSSLPLPVLGAPTDGPEPGFHFELLPRAFQSNPELEMTVITELTAFGRTRPSPSPERPTYCLIHNTGMQQRGVTLGGFRTPDPAYLENVFLRALRTSGLLPADAAHPPSVVLFLHWGSHAAMDLEMRMLFPHLALQHRLERSRLVGGRRYENFVLRRIEFGESLLPQPQKQEILQTQATNDLYFAVVSAYDYASLAAGQRRLLWRTNLTVGAIGVSLKESMPALLLSGGPYFGRDMPEPALVFRRLRRGVVEYGEPEVVETDVPLPGVAGEPAPPPRSN